MGKEGGGGARVDEVQKLCHLMSLFKDKNLGMCFRCGAPGEALAVCAHSVCMKCVNSAVKSGHCTQCSHPLRLADLFSEKRLQKQITKEKRKHKIYEVEAKEEAPVAKPKSSKKKKKKVVLSAKLRALLDEVHTCKEQAKQDGLLPKLVVFSQWTSFLDCIEGALETKNVIFRRLDGKISNMARQKAIADFTDIAEVTVILISLKAGGVGLNLTVANTVILMDPWWNPAVEAQAIDRVHRIGQQRDVRVIRIMVEKSVEEKIVKLQQKKQAMIDSALEKKKQKKTFELHDFAMLFSS